MSDPDFSWVQTHKQLTEYLRTKEDSQRELIDLLNSVGIGPLKDKTKPGREFDIDLEEIDPFTFFCFIYKYGPEKRLQYLQKIAEKLGLEIPTGESGIPSAQAQKVWLFPYKYSRTNNEIQRLWDFFQKSISDKVTDDDFQDVLKIMSTGKVKITEGLFYINPEKFLPINGPTKSYIKGVLGIEPSFSTYSEYLNLISKIKELSDKSFYELSYNSWVWNNQQKENMGDSKLNKSTNLIHSRDDKKQYWLYSPGEKARKWNEFYENGIMGLGWDEIGDLRQYNSRDEIKEALVNAYGGEGSKKNNISANDDFLNKVQVGDIVIVKKGRRMLLGYGVVTSDYKYDFERDEYHKFREVKWEKKGNWKVDFSLVLKTLTDVTKYPSEHSEYKTYYEELLGIMGEVNYPEDLSKRVETINFQLNTILYGPPGTGKTFSTVLRAAEILENRNIDSYDDALDIFRKNLHDRVEFITFHQNYSYEDFIQGLRPDTENDKELTFERKDGVFKIIADRALKNLQESKNSPVAKKSFEEAFNQFVTPLVEGEVEEIEVQMKKVAYYITAVTNKSIDFRKSSGGTQHSLSIATLRKMYEAESVLDIQGLSSYYAPLLTKLLALGKESSGRKERVEKKNYVLIIDEINRANISRVFGELITLIEPDKRSHGKIPMEVRLPSGDKFMVPSNLHLIGTMNTADKSIALLDIALRRRFVFEALYPKYEIDGEEIFDVDILKKINEQIIKSKGHDFQIGHAYFMGENNDLVKRMNWKVIPLLMEYYMNDEKEVKGILKSAGLKLEEECWPLRITGRDE